MASPKIKTTKRIKVKNKLPVIRIFLRAESNNSIITLTDLEGKVLKWSSAGKAGFKGSKKSTPFAAQKATEEVLDFAKALEANTVHLEIFGFGQGRDSFLRAIQASDLQIQSIKDVTGFAFGGPRQKGRRRV
jgi:small subunit ribosomal protein S11